MHLAISEVWTLILAVLAIWSGIQIHRILPRLQEWNIPPAITGGLVFALIITLARKYGGLELTFADTGRQTLLLIFFAGVGLSAKFRLLLKGGQSVAVLCFVILLAILMQNIIGVAFARLFNLNSAIGLFLGSIPFVGGHGTAAAWAQSEHATALKGAFEVGMASATLGLIAGGLIAGPVASFLIHRDTQRIEKKTSKMDEPFIDHNPKTSIAELLNTDRWIIITLIICSCLALGQLLSSWGTTQGWVIPGFLAVMFIAIMLTNIADVAGRPVDLVIADLTGTVALRLFLAISMMGLKLWELSDFILPLLVTTAVQIVAIALVSSLILYPLLGRGYQAAVACGGFMGCALGAMPVGLGVMGRLTDSFGPAPRGILILTMTYALFTDTVNAIIVNIGFSLLH